MASMDDSQTDEAHKHRGGGGGSSSNGHTAGERGERRFNAYVQRLFPFVRRLCESRSIANRAFFRPPMPPLYDFSSHGMDEAVGRIPAWQVKDDTLIGLRIPDSLVLDAGGEYGRATVHPIGAPSSSTDATLPASAAAAAAASASRASLAHKLFTFASAISQYHRLFNDGRREPPICDFLRQQACTRRPRMVFVPWSETYEPPSPPPPPADEKAARRKRRGRDWCGGCMGGGGCGSGAAPAVDLGVDCDDHDCSDQATEDPSPPPPDPAFIPCLVCPVDGAQTVTLYFHGNGADLGMVSHICQATATALNSTLIAMDYPGYGVCNTTPYGGEPSEEACVAAALRVLRYVLRTTCSVGGDSNDSVCAVTQPTTDDAEETLTAAVYSAPTSPSSNAAPSETPPPPPFALSPDRGSPSGAQRRVSTTDPSVGGASGSGGNGGHAAGGSSGEGTTTTTTSHRIERIPTVEWSAGAAAAANGAGAGGAGGDSYEFSDIATAHSTMRLRPVALDRIILFGQSIGTGVAMQLYRLIREGAVADLDPRRNVAGIILHSPFTSLRSIVSSIAADEAKTAAVRQSVPQPLPDHCTTALAAVETLRVLLSDGAPVRAKHPVEPWLFGLGAFLLRERFRSIDVINDVVAAHYAAAAATAVVDSADQQQRPHHLGSDLPPPLADNTGVQLPPFFIVHGVLDNLIPVQSALALADAICAAPRPAMPAEEAEVPNEFRLPGLRLVLRPHGGHNGILALEEKAAFVREVIEPTVRMKYMTAEGHGEAITPYFARALVKGGVPAKDAESAYLRKAEQLSRSQACDTVVLTALGVLVTVFGAVALPLIGRTDALSCGPAGTDSSAAESAMLNAIGACTRVGLTLLLWAVLSFFQPSTGIHLQPPTRGNCAVVMYAVGRAVLGAMLLVGVAMGIVEGVWLFSVSPAEQACWGSMVLVPGIVTASFGAFCAVLVIAALVQSH